MELVRVSVKARSEPNGVKPKMRDDKLKSGVNWQGAFKHKGRKTDGHKTKIWYNSTEQCPLEAAGRQLVRKFHTFSALTRFITLVLRLRNLHLSWDSWIQPTINLLNKLCIYTETLWYFKFISDCKTKLEQFPSKAVQTAGTRLAIRLLGSATRTRCHHPLSRLYELLITACSIQN